jgi:hypothetical protein
MGFACFAVVVADAGKIEPLTARIVPTAIAVMVRFIFRLLVD